MSAVIRSLSPSRAGDFMTCPLLYRFRTIDRIPEPPSSAAVRGTVVHRVLERLLDPAEVDVADRSLTVATDLLGPALDDVLGSDPATALVFDPDPAAWQRWLAGQPPPAPPPDQREQWLSPARDLLSTYFTLEDPRRLDPARIRQERELHVSATLDSGLVLRGIVDRIDHAPDGQVRVVDYKTGKAPPAAFEQKALFQIRFYALALWRMRGVRPRRLQLMYLGSGSLLVHDPDEPDLQATERKVLALHEAIEACAASGDWRPTTSRLCDWCAHQALCPAFGGTPPPLPPVLGDPEGAGEVTGADLG